MREPAGIVVLVLNDAPNPPYSATDFYRELDTGGVLFALTLILVLSWEPFGLSLAFVPGALAAVGIALVTVATDLLAVWALVEIGDFTNVNFQAKFKHFGQLHQLLRLVGSGVLAWR